MKKQIAFLAPLFLILSSRAQALTLSPSPTLSALEDESAKDAAGAATAEQARAQASAGFTGEKSVPGAVVAPLAAGMPGMESAPVYRSQAAAPVKADSPAFAPSPTTKKPKPKPSIIPHKYIYGPLGLGTALVLAGAGLAIAGAGAPGLLLALGVLGGIGLGIGGLLWFINKKLGGA